MLEFVKAETINLLNHPELKERWLQDRIAEDPTMLGLGDVILKDRERTQPRAGRLDLLLQDADADRRYEVEIQLGKTDEAHIIRTLEYWDIERNRYPQYDHCAVLIAEDITSRFLNVIGLFNGAIPLIAIQVKAVKFAEQVILVFTTVLDEMSRGLVDEDEVKEIVDRAYWEKRGSKVTVAMVDELLELIRSFAPGFELKYNRFYIGLAKDGQPDNFAIFRARKTAVNCEIRLKQSDEIQSELDNAGLDVMDYDKKWGRYRLRLTKGDISGNRELIMKLLKMSCESNRT